jgi:hypothetical protein
MAVMTAKGVRHLPVLERGQLVGIHRGPTGRIFSRMIKPERS